MKGIIIQVLSHMIFLFLISYADAAQPLALENAIAIALQNNPELIIAQQRSKQADEKIAQVWGMLYPALESEASAVRQHAENGFMSLSRGQYDLKFIQIKLGINPGNFYNSLTHSYSSYKHAKEEIKKIQSSVEHTVIKCYFDVILANEVIALRQNSINALQANALDVKRLYDTGAASRFEYLQAQVELQGQEPLLIEAVNNYSTALDVFNFHLGAPYGTYTVVLGTVGIALKKPLPASIVDTLVEQALLHRPEVLQLDLTKDMIGDSIDAAQSVYLWPTFSVSGYYGKSYLLPDAPDISPFPGQTLDLSAITGQSTWQTAWQIRFAATYRWGSLLPVDAAQGAEREQKERLKEIEEQIKQLKRAIAIAVRSDYGKLLTAHQAVAAHKKNIETASEGVRIARESYRAGIIKNSELLHAELKLTEARMGYVMAVNDYHCTIAQLKKNTGFDCTQIIFAEGAHEH